ncbi:MAG: DUF3592 domain-containing protein [Bacteroidia bacterium]
MAIIKPYTSLSDFDLPRTISIGLKLRIFFSNPFAGMGLGFFLFGSIFPIVFGVSADFRSAFTFKENDPAVKGTITSMIETNNKENKRRIYDYAYQYQLNNKVYTGHSFSRSESLVEGDSVLVQYVDKEPELSRIQGMRAAPFSFIVVPFTCIFPIIGFVFLLISIKRGKKNIYLVQNGILTTGKVIRKEPTNTKINKQTVYKVFFQYRSKDGNMQEAFVRSHKIQNLGDESEEPLVYDSQNPGEAVLLDALPKKIRTLLTGI